MDQDLHREFKQSLHSRDVLRNTIAFLNSRCATPCHLITMFCVGIFLLTPLLVASSLSFLPDVAVWHHCSGGTVYFGINDEGIVCGLPLARKQRDDLRLLVCVAMHSVLAPLFFRLVVCFFFFSFLYWIRPLTPKLGVMGVGRSMHQVDRVLRNEVLPPVPSQCVSLVFVPVEDVKGESRAP